MQHLSQSQRQVGLVLPSIQLALEIEVAPVPKARPSVELGHQPVLGVEVRACGVGLLELALTIYRLQRLLDLSASEGIRGSEHRSADVIAMSAVCAELSALIQLTVLMSSRSIGVGFKLHSLPSQSLKLNIPVDADQQQVSISSSSR